MLTDILDLLSEAAQQTLFRGALWTLKIYVLLQVVDIFWSFTWKLLRGESTLVWLAYRSILAAGGYLLILRSPYWFPSIANGLRSAASNLSGGVNVDPGNTIEQGFAVVGRYFQSVDVFFGIFNWYFYGAGFLILIAYLVVAYQQFRAIAELHIAGGALVFLLGFAAHPVTFGLFDRAAAWVVRLGLRIVFLWYITGVGYLLTSRWINYLVGQIYGLDDWKAALVVPLSAILYGVLATTLPKDLSNYIADGFTLKPIFSPEGPK